MIEPRGIAGGGAGTYIGRFMAKVSLQFEGVDNGGLLALLGVAVAAALLGYGLWQIVAGRRRGVGAAAVAAGALAGACVLLAAAYVPMDSAAGQLLWLVLLGAVVAAAVGVFYSVVYGYLGRRRIAALLVLRCLGILALLLILFKPALSHQPAGEAKLGLSVLVDRSGSMDSVDHADLPSRYRQAAEALSAQRRRLGEHFELSLRHFARQAQAVDDVDELGALSASGEGTDATDIAGALRDALADHPAEKLIGVILISDGLHNVPGSVLDAARESPVPIYAIGVGAETETASGRRNVQLLSCDGPLEAVRDNVTTLTAQVRLTGWANIPTRVVLSEGGRQVDAQQVLSDANAKTLTVQLKWTPGEPAGPAAPDLRRLRIAAEPNPAEATAEDNAAELHLLVTQPSIRVLYVEGTLRPEYKYLRRVLAADPNVKLISLVRLSENRFLAQGDIDGQRLLDLPRSDGDFALFDVLILGDLDRTFLSREQMEKVRRFVNDGKALLMLGGRNSFGPGGYEGTPVGAALPVVCGPRSQPQETTAFVPQLTAAGLASPVFAGLADYFHTPARKPLKPLPELLGCVSLTGPRPGADVLAIHPTRRSPDGASPLVVLAVQSYGAGRSAAFAADTTWKWYLRLRSLGADSPYDRFWGQLIRYLAGVEKKDKQQAVSVLARLASGYIRQGQKFKILAQVKDADGRPADDAAVTATLAAEGKDKPVEVALEPSAAGAGLYEAAPTADADGRFTVTVKAADKQGQALGADALPLIVAPHSQEAERLARDTATLKAVAAARDGRYAELAALPDVVNELIQRKQARLLPPMYIGARQFDLYNFTLLFLVFVGLLTAEWLLRRSWQLQ